MRITIRAAAVSVMLILHAYSAAAQTSSNSTTDIPVISPEYGIRYQYTLTIRYRKTTPGENLRYIYLSVPPSDDYQTVSNIDPHGGEIFDNPDSVERYIRYTVPGNSGGLHEAWNDVRLSFEYIASGTEYEPAVVKKILPYKTETAMFKRFTAGYYDYIDIHNPALKKASDRLLAESKDYYEYAERCYRYVLDTFTFQQLRIGYWLSAATMIETGGGDCGNLASLFINLLRCGKVPARHVLAKGHAWAEFYIEGTGWIPVDPTYKLFGRANPQYSPIRSHEFIYQLRTSGSGTITNHLVGQNHFFYPDHNPYECREEVTLVKK